MKLLDGESDASLDLGIDERDQEIEALRTENRNLRRAVNDAKVEADRTREDANRALSMLRRQLSPLYRALQAVFGELESAGVMDDAPQRSPAATEGAVGATAMDTRVKAVWDSWKARLGPQCGKAIDALLMHSDMNTTQLAIAMGTNRRNIPNIIYKLNQAGLINKNGGRFSLKQL